MKKIILIQVLVTIGLATATLPFIAAHQWLSLLLGVGTILLNFLLLAWGWSLIFKKKLIALAVGIIVFKYAILGIIIYRIVNEPWFQPLWFSLGIASFVISALIYSLSEGKEHVI